MRHARRCATICAQECVAVSVRGSFRRHANTCGIVGVAAIHLWQTRGAVNQGGILGVGASLAGGGGSA